MKTRLATPALIACSLFLALNTGAGLYQHMFDIPTMLGSPEAYRTATNNNLGQAQKFWIPLHALTLITLILSTIFNWKNPERKKLVLFVLCAYIYISLISIYFAYRLTVFHNMEDTTAFRQQTKQWILMSWHRPLLQVVCVVVLLTAISRSSLKKLQNGK